MVTLHEDYPLAPYAERELLHAYHGATADHVRRGRDWYKAARRECRRMAREHGRPLSQVAAVLAITSPDAQLSTNLRWTEEILRGERGAGRYPADQGPKVRAALASRRPGQYAAGPKVNAFYRAIMGAEDTLVIDRWAAFAAGSTKDRVPGAKARRAIAQGYRQAAASVGESVRDFQAIVWIALRESTPRANGQTVRLADITA